ncbi:MAG: hypothetical protein ACSLFK_11325, partial [Gemmatimonadaceae bacterium]
MSESTGRSAAPRNRVNLLDIVPAAAAHALRDFATRNDLPRYRVDQVLPRLWSSPAETFESISQIPKPMRDQLEREFEIPRLAVSARQLSTDGTEKFLFRLADGEHIETVAIPEGNRLTL